MNPCLSKPERSSIAQGGSEFQSLAFGLSLIVQGVTLGEDSILNQ